MSERAFAKVVPPMIAQLKHKFSISIIFQRKLPSEKRHKAEAAQHLIRFNLLVGFLQAAQSNGTIWHGNWITKRFSTSN